MLVLQSYTYRSLLQEKHELCWQSLLIQKNLKWSSENGEHLYMPSSGCQMMLRTQLYFSHSPELEDATLESQY